jgi:hypothetical protein
MDSWFGLILCCVRVAAILFLQIGTIWAKKMPTSFLVLTMEGMEHGEAGDYLAQNAVDGEQWPIDAKTFEKTYEECAPADGL